MPKNSPWLERIDKAQELAGQFQPSKDGVAQLMQKYGKNREDLQKAVGMLQNPLVQKTLGRVPGLSEALAQAGQSLLSEQGGSMGTAPASPAAPVENCAPPSGQDGNVASLMARLRKLG